MPSKGSRTYQYVADPKTGESVSKARLILERKIGRKLKKGEVVDHIDDDEKNLAPSNLRVRSARANSAEGGRHGAAVTNAKKRRARSAG